MIARGFRALLMVFPGFVLSANLVFADGNLVIGAEKSFPPFVFQEEGD
jgi:hypothetical protein